MSRLVQKPMSTSVWFQGIPEHPSCVRKLTPDSREVIGAVDFSFIRSVRSDDKIAIGFDHGSDFKQFASAGGTSAASAAVVINL